MRSLSSAPEPKSAEMPWPSSPSRTTTFVERDSAGSEATSTMPTPTTRLIKKVGRWTENPGAKPKGPPSTPSTKLAITTPRTAPATAPTVPMTNEVVRKDLNTWARRAPMAFIWAISRRCSRIIVFIVLEMRKTEHSSASTVSTYSMLTRFESISLPGHCPSFQTSGRSEKATTDVWSVRYVRMSSTVASRTASSVDASVNDSRL
jgi:hypothetical protein